MSTVSLDSGHASAAVSRAAAGNGAIRILQAATLALWIFPSDYVSRTIGGMGYIAGLIGLFGFLVWVTASLVGRHDPRFYRYPARGALAFWWVVTFASYALMHSGRFTSAELLGSQRWLMQLCMMTGLIVLAAEGINSIAGIKRVLRVTLWGATFCGVIGAIQFWLSFDLPSLYMKLIPGFTLNVDPGVTIITRDGLNRVTGTALHPIELGVTSAMLLPLAIWMAIYDTSQPARRRAIPVVAIMVSIMVSVSRSAILGVAIAMTTLILLMPVRQRVYALAAVPVAIAGAFMTAHGLIGTLVTFFGYGTRDPSISHRTNNYPYVEGLVRHNPWFGQGGGTYFPTPLHILDNQYLATSIELGLLGLAAMLLLFLAPAASAFLARRATRDPELQLLGAALGGGLLAATACSFTFDSFSFPDFYNSVALIIGLTGVTWRIARGQRRSASRRPVRSSRPPLAERSVI